MTFGLIRAGWPNAAAVLALAAMPIVAFTAEIDYRPRAEPVEHADAATIGQTSGQCVIVAAVGTATASMD